MKKVVMAMILAFAGTASAALYKCPSSSGGVEYSDSPCPAGLVKDGRQWVKPTTPSKPTVEQTPSTAPSWEDWQKARTDFDFYALSLGRSQGCGADVSARLATLKAWIPTSPYGDASRTGFLRSLELQLDKGHTEMERFRAKNPGNTALCTAVIQEMEGSRFP